MEINPEALGPIVCLDTLALSNGWCGLLVSLRPVKGLGGVVDIKIDDLGILSLHWDYVMWDIINLFMNWDGVLALVLCSFHLTILFHKFS